MNMLRRHRIAAIAGLLLSVGGVAQGQATAPAPTTIKIGYVNTQALMQVAPGRTAAESTYNKEAAAFGLQQQRWSDSLKKLVDDYKKAAPKMTDAQKQAKEQSIAAVQQELDAKNQQGQERLAGRQNELLAPLMEVVKKAIDDIRVEEGYSMIFSGDANSPIVSADKNLDVTDRVVSRLKTIAAKAPTPASPMAPAAMTKKPPTQ
jgi:Outer membrane protein